MAPRTGRSSLNAASSKTSHTTSMVRTITKTNIFKKSSKFEPVHGTRARQGVALYYVENWNRTRGGFINSLMQEIRKDDQGLAKGLNIQLIVDQIDHESPLLNIVKKDGPYARKYFVILVVHDDEEDNTSENLALNGKLIATVRILNSVISNNENTD